MTRTILILTIICFAQAKNNNLLGQKDSTSKAVDTFTVPQIQAEYPGGFKQLTKYLKENVVNEISTTESSRNIEKVIVKFFVDEKGKTTDAKIYKTSTDPKIDKLFLDAINKMPNWTPAENPKGKKIKQEFTIPLNICIK